MGRQSSAHTQIVVSAVLASCRATTTLLGSSIPCSIPGRAAARLSDANTHISCAVERLVHAWLSRTPDTAQAHRSDSSDTAQMLSRRVSSSTCLCLQPHDHLQRFPLQPHAAPATPAISSSSYSSSRLSYAFPIVLNEATKYPQPDWLPEGASFMVCVWSAVHPGRASPTSSTASVVFGAQTPAPREWGAQRDDDGANRLPLPRPAPAPP